MSHYLYLTEKYGNVNVNIKIVVIKSNYKNVIIESN